MTPGDGDGKFARKGNAQLPVTVTVNGSDSIASKFLDGFAENGFSHKE